MIDDLQSHAKGVRGPVAVARPAVEIQHVAPHGRRRKGAVSDQIVPVPVAEFRRILFEGGQQIRTVARRNPRFGQAFTHAVGLAEGGVFPVAAEQRALEPVQPRHLLLRRQVRIIRDIVGAAGEIVENGHVGTQPGRQQPGPDGEVLVGHILARRCLYGKRRGDGHGRCVAAGMPAVRRCRWRLFCAFRRGDSESCRRSCG